MEMDFTEDKRFLRHAHDFSHNNYTSSVNVSIRVTPLHDHFVSWGILWAGFLLASIFAAWQVVRENRIMASRRTQVDDGDQGAAGDAESVSTADITRSIVSTRLFLYLDTEPGRVVQNSNSHLFLLLVPHTQFRRLLLLAMSARVALIPAQIWSDPMWWQFVGDTLPEMIFASAWTLVVTFFVQLVGVAVGVGTNTSPGIVIQATVRN